MLSFKKTPSAAPQTIGVCGTAHGVGTTHFALSLSNYLCSKYRKRTAYAELNGSCQIRALTRKSDADMFDYMNITCYPDAAAEDLPRIFTARFSYVILDLGIPTTDTCRDFYRCDLKFIIGSVSPWKTEQTCNTLASLLHNTNLGQDHIVILGNMATDESIRAFRRFSGLTVCAVPFLQNPFQLTTTNCTFFQKMLAKNGIDLPR